MCPQLVPVAQCPYHSSVVESPIQFVWSAAGHYAGQEDRCLVKRSRVRTSCIFVLLLHHHVVFLAFRTGLPDVLSASVFDSCDSLHGALHFFSPWLAGTVCARTRGTLDSLGHRGVVRLSWHTFSFRVGIWPFDSSPGFHSPLCPPGGCALGLSGLRAPRDPRSPNLSHHSSFFRSSSLRSGSFHLVSFQSASILFAQTITVPRPLLPPCAAEGRTPVQRYCKSECAFNGEVVRTCCSSYRQHSCSENVSLLVQAAQFHLRNHFCPTRQTMLPYCVRSSGPACVM